MHKILEMSPPSDGASADRLESLVLARIASAPRGLDRGEIAGDLAPFAGPQMPASRWREALDGTIASLVAAGMVSPKPGGLAATTAGSAAAAKFLGVASSTPLAWDRACNVWLIAKALGHRRAQGRAPAKRLAALATLEGLRLAILVQAYGLQIKGAATPARVRQALAAAALKKAFGGDTAAALAGKTGLPARASRLLAAQLMEKPRDPGTDRRLISALAAQACGARSSDPSALRTAVLRRYFAIPEHTAPEKRNDKPAQPVPAAVVSAHARPPAPPSSAVAKPLDLPGFVQEVRRLAAGEAQGWSGDRKAYISRVWRSVRERRPEWGLSEIEFKCMLAEAHRSGQLALANADLRDASNIRDVQDSAVTYRNAVFHFIRVDA